MSVFSERLKWMREKAGFTQKEMGEKLGLSGPSYSKYEYGLREPNLETLSKLPGILFESLDFLLGVNNLDKKSQKNYERLNSRLSTYKDRKMEIFKLRFDQDNISEEYKKHMTILGPEYFEQFIQNLENLNKDSLLEIKKICDDLLETIVKIPFVEEKYIDNLKSIESEIK